MVMENGKRLDYMHMYLLTAPSSPLWSHFKVLRLVIQDASKMLGLCLACQACHELSAFVFYSVIFWGRMGRGTKNSFSF
jgi:hypothetical protein